MRVKGNKGFVGVDIILALVAITIFSVLIISLMYNNVLENAKLRKETLATIYLTEIFENIAIEEYENVIESNIENTISEEISKEFDIEISVTENLENVTDNNILKKIIVTLKYQLGNKQYSVSMERMKIKE